MLRRCGLALCLWGGTGCPSAHRRALGPEVTSAGDVDGARQVDSEETGSPEKTRCVEAEPEFENFDFLPDPVRFVALTTEANNNESLTQYEAALTSSSFSGPAQGPRSLSGDTQLAVAGLGFERQVIARTLDKLGVDAKSLLKVEGQSGDTMWLVPHRCDLGMIRERAAAHWGMELREVVGGWVGTPAPDSRLPFDLVAMSGDILLLCARGTGAKSLAWFGRAEPGSTSAVGPWLMSLPQKPWRVIVQDSFQSAGARTRASLGVSEGQLILADLPTASLPEP